MPSKKSKNLLDIVPIYSPRTTYNQIKNNNQKMISDITLNFDKTTIGFLRQQFEKKNDQLTLNQFIQIAKIHLKFWQPQMPDRQQKLVELLTQLFNQIDINGNGDMEWKQFTNYIIQKAIVLKNLKSKSEEIKRYVKSQLEPKLKIDGLIHKAEYIDEIQKIAMFQQGSSKIYFMDIHDGTILSKPLQIDPKKLVINISSVKKNKSGKVEIKKKDLEIPTEVRVLDILYLNEKKYQIFLVSTSDGFVRGWKYSQNGFILATQPDNEDEPFQHLFTSQIYCLAWDNINEVLYCGQKSGNICMWNLKTDLQKTLQQQKIIFEEKQSNQKKISMLITCMITMPKLQFMASGRMDGKLILWDTINNKKKWTYKQHTRGIMSLAFNQSMILLFSAGFDHKICVWNPYIQTLIHKIEIHMAPVLTLRVIESSNQLISLDSQGVVKVTDTKRFNSIYSFSIQKQQNAQVVSTQSNGFNLSGFIVIDKPLKLVFIGKTISMYEYDKNYNPLAADENFVVAIEYIQDTMSFITASGNKIKIWSALNGDITKIFIDISEHEITAMALDSLKKRMIIGDIEGNITVHNVLNGAKMKHLSKHNSEILSLITTKNQVQILVSCSTDNEIRIFKETEDNYQIVRYIYFRKDIQIGQLIYQTNIKLIMVGTNVGTVGFYDPETGKNVGNCLNKNLQQITSLCQTNESIMIATTSTGKINLYGIPPSNNKFQKLLTFTHRDCQKKQHVPLGIITSCYDQKKNCLFVIDDKMYFACYDLSDIGLYKIGIKKTNNEMEALLSFNEKMKTLKFKIKWQIKTNHQIIKHLKFFPEENILCTSSFDKKVKIWNAQTGEYIDSLQQNYNKSIPQPIAYYDTRKFMLIAKNKKQTIDNKIIDLEQIQSDPQKLQLLISKYESLKKERSNKDWSLQINMNSNNKKPLQKDQQKNQKYEEEADPIKQKQVKVKLVRSSTTESLGKFRKSYIHKIKEDIANYQKILMKQGPLSLHHGSQAPSQSSSNPVTPPDTDNQLGKTQIQLYSKNNKKKSQLKRGMMKCIQNCLERKQNDECMGSNQKEKRMIKTNLTKSRDFIPIYQILSSQQKKKAAEQNKKFVDHLYKTQTQSLMNSHQEEPVYLGEQEAKATRKLCDLFLKIDETDKRPKSLLKNIKIKPQISQSMHSSYSKGFPKI